MTVSEAIELLESVTNGMDGRLGDAIRMGIEALKQQENGCDSGACKISYKEN